MPIEVFYILGLLAIICVTFLVLKRPIYECMFYGYVLMAILTGEMNHFFDYIFKTSTDTLFYSIIGFLALAKILNATHAVDTVVAVIIGIFGRFGGGYPFSHMAGCDLPGAIVKWARGEEVPPEMLRAETGLRGYKELVITKTED